MDFLHMFSSAIIMILLISLLILVHELGHFLAAKAVGIRVDKFGFGLPIGPTLFSKKFGEIFEKPDEKYSTKRRCENVYDVVTDEYGGEKGIEVLGKRQGSRRLFVAVLRHCFKTYFVQRGESSFGC